MSWSSKVRGTVAAAAFGAAALALAACEFRPLYGETSTGVSTFDQLGAIQIVPLTDRTGQQLHNLLRDRLNPRGQPSRPSLLLEVTLLESIRELALRTDETATRADLNLQADFVLRRPGEEGAVFTGSSRSITSYNILQSQYATQVSEQDARERGLRELAEAIRAQVAIFLARTDD